MSEVLILLGFLMFGIWFILLWEIGSLSVQLKEIQEKLSELKKQIKKED